MAILRERVADTDAQLAEAKKVDAQERAVARKRKQRERERDEEIEQGLRSPGGTKRKRAQQVRSKQSIDPDTG